MSTRLHSFSVPSSAWLEQPCAGSRGEPSMPGGAGAFFFRSKLGLVGATVRRFAQRTFHARRGGCVRIPVPSSAWSEQPCAGSQGEPSMRLRSFFVLSSVRLEQPFAGSQGEPSMRLQSFSVPSSAWSKQPFAGSRDEPSMPKEPLFSIFPSPLSTFHFPLSTFRFPLSPFHSPLSSFLSPPPSIFPLRFNTIDEL